MAEVAANLLVKVGADIADAQKKLNTVGDSISNFGKSALKVGGMMTAGITTPLAIVGSQLVSFASDLDETRNKAVVVFGDQAAALEEWAATASTTFGLSTQAALDYTGSLGNMMVQLGATTGEALTFSQEMVGAAADLASFHNAAGGSAEVLDTMAAAFRGEYDAIQRYIPTINAAAVEQKAMAMAGKESAKELTAMEKALAAQQIILQNMGPAAGDFARTSDGLANSQRILKAEIDNVMATLGQQLLPIFSQVVGVISQAVAWFSNLDPTIQTVILAVAGLAAAAGPVIAAVGAIGTVIGALASPIGIIIAAIAALAAAWVTDFGGIRTTVTAFWEQHLKPIFDTLVTWLQDNIPVALATLAQFWEETLLPAIRTVWEFLEQYIFPVIEKLVGVYLAMAKVELQALALVWTNVLKPAIEAVWSFLQTYVMPLLGALVNVNIAALKLALEVLAGIWSNILKPAIEAVWSFLSANVIPILVDLKSILDGPVSTALNAIKGLFDAVGGAISGIGGAIQDVIGWLSALAAKLGSIKLPGWLTPGSPTPFENGLRGIADGLKEATRATRDFGIALGGLPSSAPTGLEALGATIKEIVAWMNTLASYFGSPEHNVVSAKAVADALAPIFSGLATIVDGVSALAEINLPSGDVGAMLDSLFAALTGVVQRMVALAKTFNLEGVQAAADLAEAGGKITGQLKSLVDGFKAVAGYEAVKIGQKLNALFDQLLGTVRKLLRVAPQFEAEGVAAAAEFVQAAGKITGQLASMVDGFTAVAGYVPAVIGPALSRLFDQLLGTVRKLLRVAPQFEAEGVAAAAVFAKTTATITGALKSMVDGFAAVAAYAPQVIGPTLNRLFGQLLGTVRKLLRLAPQFETEGVAAATVFVEASSKITKELKSMVDGFTAVASYVPAVIGPALNRLFDQLMGTVRKLLRLAPLFETGGVEAAATLAEAGGKIGSALGDMIDGFVAVAAYAPQVIGPKLNTLFDQLTGVVRKLGRVAALFDDDALDASVVFAEAASKILGMVKEAIEVFERLRNYTTPGIEAINRFERDMQYALERWVRWVTLTLQPLAEDLNEETAGLVEGVVLAMGAALETLAGLVAYVSPAETAIGEFIDDLGALFTAFHDWAMGSDGSEGSPAMLLAIPAELINIFNDVMGALGTAVDVLASLVEYISPTQDAINAFVLDMGRLFTAFYNWAMGDGGSEGSPAMLLAIPPELLATFSSVMSGLGTAVDTLTALVGYQAVGQAAITTFTTDYGMLFTAFHEWATTTFDGVVLDTTAAVAEVFDDVMSGLGAAVETLTGITDYTTPGTDAITAFETDYQLLMTNFATWAETTFTEESATLVGAVGAAASDVFAGLGAAVQTLVGIIGYVGPSDAAISAFETDYQLLMANFATWAETNFTDESAAIVLAVGNATEALFTGLGLAVTTLQAITTYASPTTASMDAFIADVSAVITRFADFAEVTFTDESLDFLEDFGTMTSTLFSGIGTALSTLAAIADYTVSDSDFMMALQRFNQNLLTAITSWATWITTIMEPSTASLVSEFARILGDITAGFRGALELLMDIEAANLPTTAELAAFISSLEALFTSVVSTFENVPTDLDTAAYNIMLSLHNIFTNMNPDLWAAGLQTGTHFLGGLRQSFTDVGIVTPVLTAMIDLANQLEQVLRDAWGIESPSKVAKRIGKFFVGGLRAGLRDLQSVSDEMRKAMMIDQTSMRIAYEPAASRSIVTVSFEGGYQAGMSQSDETRIATAFVNSLRRQGVAIQTR